MLEAGNRTIEVKWCHSTAICSEALGNDLLFCSVFFVDKLFLFHLFIIVLVEVCLTEEVFQQSFQISHSLILLVLYISIILQHVDSACVRVFSGRSMCVFPSPSRLCET